MAKKKHNLPYLPYTYSIGWSPAQTGLGYWVIYYGSKYGEDAHPDTFWVDYFTSSEKVAEKRLEWGEPAMIKTRKKFYDLPYGKESAKKVTTYESRVLKFVDAARNPRYLNGHNGAGEMNTAGLSPALCVATRESLGSVPVDDHRWETGEIIHPLKNRVSVQDELGHTDSVFRDDQRYLDGELKSVLIGKMTAIDKDGNTFQTTVDDPRRATGEISGNRKGQIPIKGGSVTRDDPAWINGDVSHPLKGRTSVIDAEGNTLSVPLDDQRYLDGELKGVASGKRAAFDKEGNSLGLKPTGDERWGTEWFSPLENRVTVIGKDGKTKSMSRDDPEWVNGEVDHVNKNKIAVKDRLGKRFSTTAEDPRWATKEIAGVAKKDWELYKCVIQ